MVYISKLYLCVYQTRPSWVLDVQCALVVETPLSLLQRHKLSSMVPNSAFLVHIDSCRPTRGQIEPPGKRRCFFIYFLLSVFTRKIKLQKQSAKLANIDVCGPELHIWKEDKCNFSAGHCVFIVSPVSHIASFFRKIPYESPILGQLLDLIALTKFLNVLLVIGFESGLKKIDFSWRYQVEKLSQYWWLVQYLGTVN